MLVKFWYEIFRPCGWKWDDALSGRAECTVYERTAADLTSALERMAVVIMSAQKNLRTLWPFWLITPETTQIQCCTLDAHGRNWRARMCEISQIYAHTPLPRLRLISGLPPVSETYRGPKMGRLCPTFHSIPLPSWKQKWNPGQMRAFYEYAPYNGSGRVL
jgi:hypothetical protein